MEDPTIIQQLKRHFVAILSLIVALTGLSYNTWRNERTEQNRNIRVAGFEILKTLGDLQLLVDYAHFHEDQQQGDPTTGWGKVLFIKDLAQLLPSPGPEDAERLLTTWRNNAEKIDSDNQSVQRISEDIFLARRDIIETLHRLH
ncbi:MAG: hypothetical protein V4568_02670 [Pseudomonadota bacterium]